LVSSSLSLRASVVVALSCGWMLGCAPESPPQVEPLGRWQGAIAEGYEAPDETWVMSVLHLIRGSLCSGTLIAPNVLLTAQHCVAEVDGSDSGLVQCGVSRFGQTFGSGGFFVSSAPVFEAANAGEFVGQEVVSLDSGDDDFCGNDVAVIILRDNVPESIAVPRLPRIDAPLVAGELHSVIGFGAVNEAGDDSGLRRRRDDLTIDCVGDACGVPQVKANEWVGEGGVCNGDSGGPAIDSEGRVFGVTSRGGVDCQQGVFGSTVENAAWLKDVVVRASGMGLYQAPAWTEGSTVDARYSMPIGGACASDDECPTGICLQDGEQRYCSRPCDEQQGCPLDYTCEPMGDGSACFDDSPPPPKTTFARNDRDEVCSLGGAPGGTGPARGGWLALVALVALRRRRWR
jgi:hypothetical protein